MLKYLLPMLFLCCSCQEEVFTTGSDAESFPLQLTAEVHEVAVDRRYTLNYQPSPTGDFFANLGAIGTVSNGALGTTLVLGLFTQDEDEVASQKTRMTLQFWPPELESGRAATVAELAAYFTEGRSFPFGEGPGQVRMNLDLPSAGFSDQLSSSRYVVAPEGTVRVEEVFTFLSDIPGLSDQERAFRLARLSFAGTIGIFDEVDFLAAQEDGVPYVAKNNAVVTGETVLVLQSEWR